MPHRFYPFKGQLRSHRATRTRYPEAWTWWEASGWQMMVADRAGGGLELFSYRQKPNGTTERWGARATADEVAQPAGIMRFLVAALYLHVHPQKARKALAATGQVGTEREVAAFVRRRRKLADN